MELPKIPYTVRKSRVETLQMGGFNRSDALSDGDMVSSAGISARRWPYIATRRAREQIDAETYHDVTAFFCWNGHEIAVRPTETEDASHVLFDGTALEGTVTDGEKQFVVVNTKLVIWPDKKYLDLAEDPPTLHDMGANEYGAKGDVGTLGSVRFLDDTENVRSEIRIIRSYNLGGVSFDNTDPAETFAVGQEVTIGDIPSDCSAKIYNEKKFIISGFGKDADYFYIYAEAGTFEAGAYYAYASASPYLAVTFTRAAPPDMDFICESENRLWGCSSETQTIYASALGDPTDFWRYQGDATDSYAVAVGSEGDFTGCIRLASAVLFYKEDMLYKLFGSYPAEYSLSPYRIDGVRKDCSKSMQVLNETLFYVGIHGVYAYSGGTPTLISSNFGEMELVKAVGGNDSDTYLLSAQEAGGRWHLLTYETRQRLWVHEDTLQVVDFARDGRDVFFLNADGEVWQYATDEDDPYAEWHVQFAPMYETIQGRKRYSKLLLRMQLALGSALVVLVRMDGGAWREISRIVGRTENVVPVRVPLGRCDKFELRLEGKGPCTLLGMSREFSVGSEV